MKTQYSPNVKIPVEFIIEIGMCRKRCICALCGNKIKGILKHNIQLCIKCREIHFKKYCLKTN